MTKYDKIFVYDDDNGIPTKINDQYYQVSIVSNVIILTEDELNELLKTRAVTYSIWLENECDFDEMKRIDAQGMWEQYDEFLKQKRININNNG